MDLTSTMNDIRRLLLLQSEQLNALERFFSRAEPESSELLDSIEVGRVTYFLKRPIRVTLKPVLDHEFEISSDLLPDVFVGRGPSIEQARDDFMVQVHREFQSLVKLRPHKRSEEQTRRWEALASVIDVDRYWEETPVVLMEVGHVESFTTEGHQLVWLDGDRRETVSLRLAPPEFAALGVGDWFEALVERQATTAKLQAIRFVKPIEPLSVMSEDELREWFASLPRASNPAPSEFSPRSR